MIVRRTNQGKSSANGALSGYRREYSTRTPCTTPASDGWCSGITIPGALAGAIDLHLIIEISLRAKQFSASHNCDLCAFTA